MADYALGDIQGCYEPLMRLLDKLQFNEREDRLWLVGDLVNRGPHSLAVLRFIKALPLKPRISLGNHDLHLLGSLFGGRPWRGHDDTLHEVLQADDAEELGHWLRGQGLIHYDAELGYVMSHAGIAPIWDLAQAQALGDELAAVLAGPHYAEFLKQMYGNTPNSWSDSLPPMDRLRLLTNYFTRMRFCDAEGALDLSYKGGLAKAPEYLYPWFLVPKRKDLAVDILFGHWAALEGRNPHPRIHALDTGCLWGGQLTALRLQDKQRISVAGMERQ